MNYLELAKGMQEEISLRLKEWIKIPSVYDEVSKSKTAPFGEGVANALKYIASIAKQDGFEVDTCDGYCTEITYGQGDPMVLILGHADVVPAGRGWEYAPFDPVEKDGKIYGRGTSDDKGPTLAAYHALKLIKELNIPLKRKIRLVVGGNEESGSRCLDYYFGVLKKPHGEFGFSPDADFPLIYAEKGIMNFVYHGVIADENVESFEAGVASNSVPEYAKAVLTKEVDLVKELDQFSKQNKVTYKTFVESGKTVIEINGKAAHGGSPQQGINAASVLISFLAEQFESPLFTYFAPKVKNYDGSGLGIAYQEEEMGPVSVNLGIFTYKNHEYNMILNIRYPKSMASKKIIQKLESHILHDGKEYGNSEPLYVSPDSQLVKTLLKAYQEVSGDDQSKPYTISGGTYARHTTNSVAFGMAFPGEDNLIHQHDEYVNIESLVQGTAIYLKALIELANI